MSSFSFRIMIKYFITELLQVNIISVDTMGNAGRLNSSRNEKYLKSTCDCISKAITSKNDYK
jgi:hypothetical protein